MHDEPTTQPSLPGAGESYQPEGAPPAGYGYYQGPPIPPTPPAPARGRGFWSRPRNRWLLAGGAALVLLIAIAGGVAFAAHQNDTPTTTSSSTSTGTPTPSRQQNMVYTVVTVSGTTITATRSGGGSVTITTSPKTTISRAGQPASLSDLTAGTKFRVRGKTRSDGSIAATRIEIVVPTVKGTLTAINGDTLTVQTRKKTVSVLITPSTTIVDATTHGSVAASSLTVGETVTIQGVPNGNGTYTALRIVAGTPQSGGSPSATSTPAA